MAYLSFDEKAWDKIRPFTVKKTGLSEAIRAVEAVVPKQASDLNTEAACNAAVEALDTLALKLTGAKGKLDPKKHEDAVKKLVAWGSEVAVRRKAMATQATQLHDTYEKAIQEADKAVTPFFEEATHAEESINDMVAVMNDRAKKALVAAAKGDTDTLLDLKDNAEQARVELLKLVKRAQALFDLATKAAEAQWPPYKQLSPGQQQGYVKTLDRTRMIKYKAERLSDPVDAIAKAFDTVVLASSKGEGMREKFVSLVESDAQEVNRKASELGSTDSNVALLIERTTQFISGAEKPQVPTSEKQQMVAAAALQLKEALGTFKRLVTQADQVSKAIEGKLESYPDFVTRDDKAFQPSLVALDKYQSFAEDTAKVTVPRLSQTLKTLGERLVRLKEGLQQN